MVKLLHFADAHIDMVTVGRRDPETGLPIRAMDFLAALDQIIDRALSEPVDLVIFAGDAYKDRNPQPTYQREWGTRLMRLSEAGIPTVLLVGNHDVSPAAGRAHTLHEFSTLRVPHIHVADRIAVLTPEQLGVPARIITLPWVSYHAQLRRSDMAGLSTEEILNELEARLAAFLDEILSQPDDDIPTILTAHASVQNAVYGSERQVMLGQEIVLGGSTVNDPRLDYVALGHIHKHQDVSGGRQPPIVYPGSIERIDFGEVNEKKGFVLAEVSRGQTRWTFEELDTRRFLEFSAEAWDADTFMETIMAQLPDPERITDAVCRLHLHYERRHEGLLDEATIGRTFQSALLFHMAKHRTSEQRSRLGDTIAVEELTPEDLLATYWQTIDLTPEEAGAMQQLARDVLGDKLLH